VLVLGLGLLPGFHRHVTTDGISYLAVAEHYAAGSLTEAVNGYWSPLLSWLLAPVVAIGVPDLLAFKLLNLLIAIGVLWATRRLARGIGATESSVEVASWALALPLVAAAYAVMSPDLLAVLPVLLYLELLVGLGRTSWWRTGALLGAAAGLAYLAKLFALPFVAVHLPLALALLAWRRGAVPVLRAGGLAVLVGGLIIGAWGGALTAKYGQPTLGTAASANLEFMAPGSPGAAPLWIGLLPPPHPEATSAWEDLPRSLELAEQTAASADGDPAFADATDTPDGGLDPAGLLRRGIGQLGGLAGALLGWLPVVLLAAGLPLAIRAARASPSPRRGKRHAAARPTVLDDPWPAVVVALAAAVWAGGVLLTYPQTRYLWAALLPAATLAAVTLDVWRIARPRDSRRELAAALLVLGLLPWAANELSREWRASDGGHRTAELLAAEVDLENRRVASLTGWVRGVGTCHLAGCTYYGVPQSPPTPEGLREELDRYDIELVIAFGPPPDDLELGEPIGTIHDGRIAVYDVR
jgi:hypothetical protein